MQLIYFFQFQKKRAKVVKKTSFARKKLGEKLIT